MADEDKQDEEIQRSIDCMFEDFDVDCDGKLVSRMSHGWENSLFIKSTYIVL